MADLDNLNLPKTIGRYQVLRLLGSGAMGLVVLAEDPRIKRKVAIKLMKPDAANTEADRHEHLLRFQREAEVSGLLNHPGIVAIYDVGEEEGYGPFLAMEYVPGKPLDGLMKEGGVLANKEKLRIAAGLADALDHAHAKGIVHRDVKPGNVMVGEDGRPLLEIKSPLKKEQGGDDIAHIRLMPHDHQLIHLVKLVEEPSHGRRIKSRRKLIRHHHRTDVREPFGENVRGLHGPHQGAGKDQVGLNPFFEHGPGGFSEKCPPFRGQIPLFLGDISGPLDGSRMPDDNEFHGALSIRRI